MAFSKSKSLTILINLLMAVVLLALGYLLWLRYFKPQDQVQSPSISVTPTVFVVPTIQPVAGVNLSNLKIQSDSADLEGILRKVESRTIIPERSRVEVITYTVKRDDTLFGIAELFGLKPETILWGNFDILQDNPHLLKPDQVLNILPIDGTYYKLHEGETLAAIAAFFGVDLQAIIDYPGNHADLTALDSPTAGIQADQWIIIPGGKRAIKDWGPPAISRKNPAAARYYGDGSCGLISEGAIGTGTFIWPTTEHSISGYNFSGIHPAIDIAGATGNPVFASDSGVVVFSGWSNYGYGYMIVLDHGNGYQTAYAHLSANSVGCGQSVFQGNYIGAVGNTGNSAGSHLHFELSYNGVKLNPLDYLR
jgi:hypothetical protein